MCDVSLTINRCGEVIASYDAVLRKAVTPHCKLCGHSFETSSIACSGCTDKDRFRVLSNNEYENLIADAFVRNEQWKVNVLKSIYKLCIE